MSELETETIEHHTMITACCEVEPEIGLAITRCPDCGQHDPRTVDRVTIERVVADSDGRSH